jgi:phage protein U
MYGAIVFGTSHGVVSTFNDLKKTVSARWSTHEVFGDKPMLEYAGPELISLTFEMELITPVTINPTATIVQLQEIMDLAIPLPLVIGKIPMGRDASLFVMESLDVNPEYFFRGGTIMGAKVNVTLKEYPTNFVSSLLNALKGAVGGLLGGLIPANVKAATPIAQLATEAAAAAPAKITSVAIASRM